MTLLERLHPAAAARPAAEIAASDLAAAARFEASALRKVGKRLIPFVGVLYFAAFIDRVNVSFAAAQMSRDLGFSAYVYGLGAGIFFVGYCLFEVPSNLILHKVGGRRWLARIMITWALVAGAMALVKGAAGFYVLRFLLGAAEAGFFPGVIYYLTYWVPAAERARLVGSFMTAIPISTALGGPVSSALLRLDGTLGLSGWQWLYLTETIPSLALGIATLFYLPDTPAEASWLTAEEAHSLTRKLESERSGRIQHATPFQALRNSRVLALGLCYFGVEIGLYGVILWVPQIFAHAGIAAGSVGSAVAIPYAIAAIVMVWWSRHSDRQNERVWHIAIASLAAFAGLAASAWLTNSPTLSMLAISLGAAGTLAILPIFWTLPASILDGAAAACAIATINALGNAGGFAGPFLIGWIKDSTGSFSWGLLAVAASVLSTGMIAVLIGDGRSAARHNPRVASQERSTWI
ncbi:MAG: MFS transporter [Steroidobacteraceae bacterium]